MDDLRIDPRVMTGCLGKTKFESRKHADKALKRVQEFGRLRHQGIYAGKIAIYKCGNCHFFHHGHENFSSAKHRNQRSMRLSWDSEDGYQPA